MENLILTGSVIQKTMLSSIRHIFEGRERHRMSSNKLKLLLAMKNFCFTLKSYLKILFLQLKYN